MNIWKGTPYQIRKSYSRDKTGKGSDLIKVRIFGRNPKY